MNPLVLLFLCLLSTVMPCLAKVCDDYESTACRIMATSTERGLCGCRTSHKRICCNFDGQNGILEPEDIHFYEDVKIANASRVILTPNCAIDHNVTFINVKEGILQESRAQASLSDCRINIKALNSSMTRIVNYQSVKLDNATALSIEQCPVSVKLDIVQSSVKAVLNVSLIESQTRHHECFILEKSEIETFENVKVGCNSFFSNSRVKNFSNVELSTSRISYSKIEQVQKNGLIFTDGFHTLKKMTFGDLAQNAIVIQNGAKVLMVGVSIQNCNIPCILVHGGIIIPTSIKIKDEVVNTTQTNQYILNDQKVNSTKIFGGSWPCVVSTLKIATCNLTDFRSKEIEFIPYQSALETEVSNQFHFNVNTECYYILKLVDIVGNINGEGDAERLGVSQRCKYKPRNQLYIESSKFHAIHSKTLKVLSMRHSEVDSIMLGNVTKFDLISVQVHTLENLAYSSLTSSSDNEFSVKSSSFHRIIHLTLYSEGTMSDMAVTGTIEKIVINHAENSTTKITDSAIEMISSGGISIVSGILELGLIDLKFAGNEAIKLSRKGKLIIKGIEDFSCDNPAMIVAPKRSKVVYSRELTPEWLRQCTSINNREDFRSDLPTGFEPITREDCDIVGNMAICDLRDLTGPSILGVTNDLDLVKWVNISNAVNPLSIGDHCFDEIRLHSSVEVDILEHEETCSFNLFVYESGVANIQQNVLSMTLHNSFIGMIRPNDNMINTFMTWNHIDLIEIKRIMVGIMDNSTIGNIKKLGIGQQLAIESTTIDRISDSAININPNSTLSMKKCVIENIYTNGIKVEGSLFLRDVVIKTAAIRSINVIGKGYIHFTNVTFVTKTPGILYLEKSPSYVFEKVALGGEEISSMDELTEITDESALNFDSATAPPDEGFKFPKKDHISKKSRASMWFLVVIPIAMGLAGIYALKYVKQHPEALYVNRFLIWVVDTYNRIFRTSSNNTADLPPRSPEVAPSQDDVMGTLAAPATDSHSTAPTNEEIELTERNTGIDRLLPRDVETAGGDSSTAKTILSEISAAISESTSVIYSKSTASANDDTKSSTVEKVTIHSGDEIVPSNDDHEIDVDYEQKLLK